ncbi:MAG: hypothetical protein V4755_15985, partial [Curtobacterium sp.]
MAQAQPDAVSRASYRLADYHPLATGHAAAKLASSGVAPLVAAARGYQRADDADGVRSIADAAGCSRPDRVTTKFRALVTDDDADLLVLPWFSLNDVATAATAGTEPQRGPTQIRPSNPREDSRGKPRKYEFLAGQTTVIDLHPAVTADWIQAAPKLLLTEGVIKADSATSAMLAHFHGSDALRIDARLTQDNARTRVRELLAEIPTPDRTLVLAVAGVGNWHKNPEWNAIRLDDRTVAVAFDGDVHTNRHVRKQAQELFDFLEHTKHATPMLVDLDSALVAQRKQHAGVDPESKVGIDDFLAALGSWSDLEAITTATLPESPAREPSAGAAGVVLSDEGMMRVDPDRPWVTQEFARQDVLSPPVWRDWSTAGVYVSGRVRSAETRRRPGETEIASGEINPELDATTATTTVRVEVTTARAADGSDLARHVVTGPQSILTQSPSDWHATTAHIPAALALSPSWPPTRGSRARGAEWLAAIKAHESERVETIRAWDTMGWAPDDTGWCSFVIGDQVISRDPARVVVVPGVTEAVLGGASKFGVADHFADVDFDTWRSQFIDDARTVITSYALRGPWADEAYGILGIAAMLRPTIPLVPTSVIYAYGPPNSGKSHWASFVMSGWQREGGTWTGDSLPGSANDSLAAMEDSIARVPIWVADDLAPSPSRGRQESRESALTDIIRNVHNHTARRRMDGVSGRQRVTNAPTALLVITAENELDSASAIQRAIQLPFLRGVFSDDADRTTGAVAARDAQEPAASRLVAGMIRYWLMPTLPGAAFADDWAGRVEVAERMREVNLGFVKRFLNERYGISGGEIDRQAKKISDLTLALSVLRTILSQLGVPEDDPMMRNLGWADGAFPHRLLRFAVDGARYARGTTPGRNIITAIASVLGAHRAHIANPVLPGNAPVLASAESGVTQEHADFLNTALGWRKDPNGAWTPSGDRIGVLVNRADGSRLVVLDSRAAFHVAQRNHA